MKILVTGGAGFIGSHIVDAYLDLGHSVSVVDNLSTGRRENVNPRATLYQVDIRNLDEIKKVFSDASFDLVNHHAAQMDVRKSVDDPAYDASVNIIGLLNLLECSVKSGVSRIVFASSGGAIYGEQDYFPADEQHPTRPISPYGVAKLASEQYLYYYQTVHGLQSASLRYANVYGPRQNPEGEAGVVAIFTSKMLSDGDPLINGDGKQTRDYVYVGDVVAANVLALDVKASAVFNVGTGKETDVNQLFHHLRNAIGAKCDERHGPAKKGEQLRSVLSHAKISKSLNWSPRVSLGEGLKLTARYFRDRTKQ